MVSRWSHLITTAEKLIGGPAPFINLGPILSSETGYLAARARRLAASIDHPFFGTVRAYLRGKAAKYSFLPFCNSSTSISDPASPLQRPSGGLMILLVGQCYAGSAASSIKLCGQHRKLAEIYETAQLAVTIHKSLVDPKSIGSDKSTTHTAVCETVHNESLLKDLEIGNKVATLAGDVLFASISTALASLHNAHVVDVVSESMGNMFTAEFSPLALQFNRRSTAAPLPAVEHCPSDHASIEWFDYVGLARGSILGSCCQSTVLLTDSFMNRTYDPISNRASQVAYRLGYSWALLTRLLEEREHFRRALFILGRTVLTADAVELRSGKLFSRLGIPDYMENGLSELTYADAILRDGYPSEPLDCTSEFRPETPLEQIECVLSKYSQMGTSLLKELRSCLEELQAVSMSTEKTSSTALDLLNELVDCSTSELQALSN